jgi:hypothetical protein
VARDEGVAAHHARDDARAQCPAEQLDEKVLRIADAVQVLRHLQRRAGRIGEHALLLVGSAVGRGVEHVLAGEREIELEDVGRTSILRVVFRLARAVPGAVGAEHDRLHGIASATR